MKKRKSATKRRPQTARPRKASAPKKSAPKKKAPQFSTVAEYLARVAEPARSALNQMRAAIREVVPAGSTEVISYNIPAFKHEKVLVWYAAFTGHCSLFPGSAVIQQFKDELKGYTVSKGTVQFPIDRALPLELIKKLAGAKVERE